MHKLSITTALIMVSSVFGISSNVQAATISDLTGFSTNGGQSAGMEVKVTFTDNTTSSAVWSTSGISGSASSDGWTLSQSGNTFSSPWLFSNNSTKSVSSLFINAITGSTVFDRIAVIEVTPGSADGWEFSVVGGVAPSSFNYSNIVNLVGQPALGDLYAALTINWSSGLANNSLLRFRADTDSAIAVIDPTDPKPVPVPTAFIGIGVAGALLGKKAISRKQKSQ
ncbi:hypothetical protein [Pseudanabaena yagii]|uniref:PEP-CTERM sorting domain-containing protein n=1 Tax=Pseudanabaena yagii GIHE-NHR1 TaxID=2722753 RepID=A0ABX1LXK4_9CYAN|nr:hypothetical protein [Pseudanabaena yagii]NMF59504.1 hypothetical protein [Pseudanabaena yagii GIHE-NHR1]